MINVIVLIMYYFDVNYILAIIGLIGPLTLMFDLIIFYIHSTQNNCLLVNGIVNEIHQTYIKIMYQQNNKYKVCESLLPINLQSNVSYHLFEIVQICVDNNECSIPPDNQSCELCYNLLLLGSTMIIMSPILIVIVLCIEKRIKQNKTNVNSYNIVSNIELNDVVI